MPLYGPQLTFDYLPPDHAYFGESFPIQYATGSTALPTAGRVEVARIKVPSQCSVTNVVAAVATAGNTLTAGQCFAALYTAAGALVGVSADQAAAWVGTGLKVAALAGGPFTLAAGEYYGAYWFNGTTGPAMMRLASGNSAFPNASKAAPNLIAASADTSITTTAPPNLGTQTAISSTWWFGLS